MGRARDCPIDAVSFAFNDRRFFFILSLDSHDSFTNGDEMMFMHFAFASFSDFIKMGRHGDYVWIAYAIVFIALTVQWRYAKKSQKNAKN